MGRLSRAERDRERRETVRRYHWFKDQQEDFEEAKARAQSAAEVEELTRSYARLRRDHRLGDTERGRRSPGLSVQMRQNMWARWLEVASEHAHLAATAYIAMVEDGPDQLGEELRQSLVAITASAFCVEALYEDLRYLVESRPAKDTAAESVVDILEHALGLSSETVDWLHREIGWLFDLRNSFVHPYSESKPTVRHPVGVNTSHEHSLLNAMTSRRALMAAVEALAFGETPPAPANRWVRRWSDERSPYHERIVAPIRDELGRLPRG